MQRGGRGADLLHNCAMQHTSLIELSRGGTLENQHFGSIAVVDTTGHLLAFAGDPEWTTFTRSTLKALQALPFLEDGGAEHFGFDSEQIALMCASHNGEERHVSIAERMLGQAGLGVGALRCGCHVPLRFSFFDQAPPAGQTFDARYNNCSGKHAGFLAYCVQHGLSRDDYTEVDHPLQQAVRRDVARAVGVPAQALKRGIDGCSAPNYAMPLSRLAYGYARLAQGAADPEFGGSFSRLFDAMTAHPDVVSGAGRNDLDLMRAGSGDWVSKVGADGVQVVASRSRGQAFAIKIIDANKPALFAATIETLEQLGWLNDAQREALLPWRARQLVNARGLPVGERRAVFRLQEAS